MESLKIFRNKGTERCNLQGLCKFSLVIKKSEAGGDSDTLEKTEDGSRSEILRVNPFELGLDCLDGRWMKDGWTFRIL